MGSDGNSPLVQKLLIPEMIPDLRGLPWQMETTQGLIDRNVWLDQTSQEGLRGSSAAGPPGAGWPGADPSSGVGFPQGWSLHGVAVPEQRHPPRKTGNFLVVHWNSSCSCLSLVAPAHSGVTTEEILTLSSPPLRCWHCPAPLVPRSPGSRLSIPSSWRLQGMLPSRAHHPAAALGSLQGVPLLSCDAQHWTQRWGQGEGTGGLL